MRLYYSHTPGAGEKEILNDFLSDPNGILIVLNETRRNAVLAQVRPLMDFESVKARVITHESARNSNFTRAKDSRFSLYVEDVEALLVQMFRPHELRAVAHAGVLIDLDAELEP